MSDNSSQVAQLPASLPQQPAKPLGLGTGVEVIRLERPGAHTDSPYRSPWAAKRANPRLAKAPSSDTALAHRLVSEADVLARLKHPGIIGYRGLLIDNSLGVATSLLMQFGGRSLMEAIEERQEEGHGFDQPPTQPFDSEFIVSMATQAAEALRYLHYEQKLMHGDLKSANLLLTDDGRLRMCDFGSALPLSGDALEAPPGAEFRGTELWAAPEALRTDRFGHKADMWSLGMILYELLTLDLPHGDLFLRRADETACSLSVSRASDRLTDEERSIDESLDDLLSSRLGTRPPLPAWLLPSSARCRGLTAFERLTEIDPAVRLSAVQLLQLLAD
ncbi:hypothetical protein BOX15_Mlig016631g1 [Macrostomum lignano]|uniref:non-specific serine/threonine protein kinase n=2 Tax=Macrostomum lignano TaxID=282301 RepID=A0A267F252_9PLAT|nr:hypothetical protein BOX15_Mlig016631g1 [Macrostomum lignano]